MDQLDIAIHNTAHNSTMTAQNQALAIGCSHQVFLNKTNPNSDTNKLTLREALAMMIHSKNTEILQVLAGSVGGEFVPTVADTPANITVALLGAMTDIGEVCSSLEQVLDGKAVTSRTVAAITGQIAEARKSLVGLEQVVLENAGTQVVDIGQAV